MKLLSKYFVGFAIAFLCSATILSAADIPKGTFSVTSDNAVWDLSFDAKGKYRVTKDGTEAVLGIYKTTKDEIEFVDEGGPLAEPGKTGTYKWKYADKKLEFTIVKDEADGRSMTLTGGLWEKKE